MRSNLLQYFANGVQTKCSGWWVVAGRQQQQKITAKMNIVQRPICWQLIHFWPRVCVIFDHIYLSQIHRIFYERHCMGKRAKGARAESERRQKRASPFIGNLFISSEFCSLFATTSAHVHLVCFSFLPPPPLETYLTSDIIQHFKNLTFFHFIPCGFSS